MLLQVVGVFGCATTRGQGADLSYLRGQPVLVIAEMNGATDPATGLGPAAVEGALARALTLLPLRIWPGAADSALHGRLAGASARLSRAQEAAETRRLPWMLVHSEAGLRLQTTRSSEVLWKLRWDSRHPLENAVRGLSRVLRSPGAAGAPSPPSLLRIDEIRLADEMLLAELRQLALAQRWPEHRRLALESVERWPADPAIRVHAALTAGSDDSTLPELRLAVSLNPEGESELLALALAAESAGQAGLALRWRELLVKLFPQRLDYRPELADRLAEHDDPAGALRVCRSGLAHADGESIDRLAPGTAPHKDPTALPYADLRFATGWHLALSENWELAAHNYLSAAKVYAAFGRPRERGDALNNAGVAMVEAGRPLAAAAVLRRAVELRALQGSPGRTATSGYNLARSLADANRLSKALTAYQEAEAGYLRAGAEREARETALERLSVVARTGDAEAFEVAARELLERLDGPGDEAGELLASYWYELGRGRQSLGRAELALQAYAMSLEMWRRLDSRLEMGQLLYSMASSHLALLRFAEAHSVLVSSLEIAVELKDTSSILAIREQLGQLEALLEARGEALPAIPDELRPWLEPGAAGRR